MQGEAAERAEGAPGSGQGIEHASAVAVRGSGVLILGPSGSGKSMLALRMLALGAGLVADDRVVLARHGDAVIASAPAPLVGLIEARGVGILRLAAAPPAPVRLVVDLASAPGARMPQRRKIALLGVEIGLIAGAGVPNLDSILTLLAQAGGELV